MSMFTDEVVISNTPLTVEGGNSTAIKVDGSAVTQPVSGSVSVSGSVTVGNFPAVQPVSGPLTDAQLRATPVPVSGSLTTTPVTSNNSTVTQITSTSSNQTLLAANPNRRKAILYFNTGIWYLKFGVGASSSSKTLSITSNNTLIEVDNVYTGQIDAFCTSSGKLVDVTELTA